jgi:hypothetical protein
MKKKSSKPKAAAVPDEKGKNVAQVDDSENKPFDFGGLPDRDLKKNLGCG